MIKIKRVGNISMGIVLITFGITLFMSQFKGFSVLNAVSKIWPVILILLGLEILWCRYVSKDDNTAIKYDLFSIFIVIVILCVNIGIYAIEESGLMSRLQRTFISECYNMDAALNEYAIDEGINKIIINDTDNLVVRASEGNIISGVVNLSVYAANKKEADDLISSEHIQYKKSGSTLYVYPVNNISNNYSYSSPMNVEMFIPQNIDVEIMNCNNLDLIYAGFNNKWTLDGIRITNIRIDKLSDVKIDAFVESADILDGNIKWSFNNFGEYINGEGSNLINILNSSNITVNEI